MLNLIELNGMFYFLVPVLNCAMCDMSIKYTHDWTLSDPSLYEDVYVPIILCQ
jgi:hypothetical protein